MKLRLMTLLNDPEVTPSGKFEHPLEITPSALAFYRQEDIEECYHYLQETVKRQGPISFLQEFIDPDRVIPALRLMICDESVLEEGSPYSEGLFQNVIAGTMHDLKPESFAMGD